MNKVILPWLPNYLSLKTQSDAAIDDVNLAFFNGIGLQINLDQKFDTPKISMKLNLDHLFRLRLIVYT